MKVRILGAHNIESAETGCSSILIDGVLAVDAGALTRSLSFNEQRNLKAVLLTHRHYDHIRDIPALSMNFNFFKATLTLYGSASVYEALTSYLLDGAIYPNFLERPPENPTLRFVTMEAGKTETIAGNKVTAIPVRHAVPTTGYNITAPDGKQVFITSDTGPGLDECWRQVTPQLLVIELTTTNEQESAALEHGHLTPILLQKELESFRRIKGYLPQIAVTHMNALDEQMIKQQTAAVEKALNVKIHFAQEGMILTV
jgi:ribonuclease BN (tRNA processing enzyme)